MFEYQPKPKRQRRGRLKQLNKQNRFRRAYFPRSEFIIHCERQEALREARGW